jgi:SAM-dependent methyltransferase
VISRLKAHYLRQQFHPGFLGIFVNPFFIARRALAESVREFAPYLKGDLLDVGCGTKPYLDYFDVTSYQGLDIDSEQNRFTGHAEYFYVGDRFPLPDGSFDAVLCNQVFEHVFNPEYFLSEINRVLKEGSLLILTVPFVWDEHEQPNDFARYSSFGLKALLVRNGFEVIKFKKMGADASILCQLTNGYLFKITRNWPKAVRVLLNLTVIAAFNLLGLVVARLLPKNPDLYLDQIVLARKIQAEL